MRVIEIKPKWRSRGFSLTLGGEGEENMLKEVMLICCETILSCPSLIPSHLRSSARCGAHDASLPSSLEYVGMTQDGVPSGALSGLPLSQKNEADFRKTTRGFGEGVVAVGLGQLQIVTYRKERW